MLLVAGCKGLQKTKRDQKPTGEGLKPNQKIGLSAAEAYEGAGASRQNLRFQAEPWMAPDATGPKASGHLLTTTVILSAEGMDARSESCDRIHKNQKVPAIAL